MLKIENVDSKSHSYRLISTFENCLQESQVMFNKNSGNGLPLILSKLLETFQLRSKI